jgi:hypothetical protein
MKRHFTKPCIDILIFDEEELITASGETPQELRKEGHGAGNINFNDIISTKTVNTIE